MRMKLKMTSARNGICKFWIWKSEKSNQFLSKLQLKNLKIDFEMFSIGKMKMKPRPLLWQSRYYHACNYVHTTTHVNFTKYMSLCHTCIIVDSYVDCTILRLACHNTLILLDLWWRARSSKVESGKRPEINGRVKWRKEHSRSYIIGITNSIRGKKYTSHTCLDFQKARQTTQKATIHRDAERACVNMSFTSSGSQASIYLFTSQRIAWHRGWLSSLVNPIYEHLAFSLNSLFDLLQLA